MCHSTLYSKNRSRAHIQFYTFNVLIHRRRKVDWPRSKEFVIGGYTAGNPFDALIIGCYDGPQLKFAAKVRKPSKAALAVLAR